MGDKARLVHGTSRCRLGLVLREGLKPTQDYADCGLEMRRGVVYCWLRKEDDKLRSAGDRVYVEVTVDRDRCVVAEMDLISMAQMYLAGLGGKPKNPEAARLLAEAYRVTSAPLSEYHEGMFWTPEVLVKGEVGPECIRALPDEGE